jgi:inner membrane transporter RhtA
MVSEGSFRISALRLACAALVILVLVRPGFRRYDRQQWVAAIALGIAMAVMVMCYFAAVAKIPAGAAIAIEFLGPVGVAVLAMKGWPRVALPSLAALGVIGISFDGGGWLFDPVGMLFALGGAAGWAAYIVLMRRIGRLFSEQDGVCLAVTVAALLALPISFLLEPGGEWLPLLPAIAGLALLSPLIPFVLEMMALRRMEVGPFSILMSLEPALGVLFGLAILQQHLTLQQTAGVAAVMIASAAAVLLSSKTSAQPS